MGERQDWRKHLGTYLNCLRSVTLDVGRGGKDRKHSENHEFSILNKMVIKGKDSIDIKTLH
jgi:hypothetical protein